ncbi:hypothetical protein [Sphingobium algorifonticola]|uniref:Phage shock protein B n=1 Tax=Sphingobium algorifonticola TaxID=2008318 RepID=A0A437JB28_9SPHN|nr:hypothetical protein [Sphingobium algorifonticola]RVT43095.1 hypothetical protein ENE74_00170 [Sphingobium algorifonticola]
MVATWIWVLIPLAAIGVKGFKSWLDLKERQLAMQSHETAEKTAQYAAQTERLEQRVRVLERIITDKGVDLSDEIEKLRDTPLN